MDRGSVIAMSEVLANKRSQKRKEENKERQVVLVEEYPKKKKL